MHLQNSELKKNLLVFATSIIAKKHYFVALFCDENLFRNQKFTLTAHTRASIWLEMFFSLFPPVALQPCDEGQSRASQVASFMPKIILGNSAIP